MPKANPVAQLATIGAVVGASLGTLPVWADAPPATTSLARYDKDNDKTLDLAEVKAAAATLFAKLDKDNDGALDAKEIKGRIGAAAFKVADPDNDGMLSKDEYLACVQKTFEKADVDRDGKLDAGELSSKAGGRLRRLIG